MTRRAGDIELLARSASRPRAPLSERLLTNLRGGGGRIAAGNGQLAPTLPMIYLIKWFIRNE